MNAATLDGRRTVLRELMTLPGVGKSIAVDLWDLGFRSIAELRFQDPDEMYDRLQKQRGQAIDRCMLYVFRCIVYVMSEEPRDPELSRWWNWTDARMNARQKRLERSA